MAVARGMVPVVPRARAGYVCYTSCSIPSFRCCWTQTPTGSGTSETAGTRIGRHFGSCASGSRNDPSGGKRSGALRCWSSTACGGGFECFCG